MSADLVHPGHLNVIRKAAELDCSRSFVGDVVCGADGLYRDRFTDAITQIFGREKDKVSRRLMSGKREFFYW